MTSSFRWPGAIAAVAVMMATLQGQSPTGTPASAYAELGKLPDWSGAWIHPFDAFSAENIRLRDPKSADRPRLRPEYDALLQAVLRRPPGAPAAAGDGMLAPLCLPQRMPYVMTFSFAIEFLFSPGRVTMLLEQGSVIRRIYTDGRPHEPGADATWTGDSIGRWDGDTLVVHTTSIRPRPLHRNPLMTSAEASITERIRLLDPNRLQIETTVVDAVTLLEPWRITRIYERTAPVFYDRVCDNNRDGNEEEPDLTPPPRG